MPTSIRTLSSRSVSLRCSCCQSCTRLGCISKMELCACKYPRLGIPTQPDTSRSRLLWGTGRSQHMPTGLRKLSRRGTFCAGHPHFRQRRSCGSPHNHLCTMLVLHSQRLQLLPSRPDIGETNPARTQDPPVRSDVLPPCSHARWLRPLQGFSTLAAWTSTSPLTPAGTKPRSLSLDFQEPSLFAMTQSRSLPLLGQAVCPYLLRVGLPHWPNKAARQ